MPKPSSRWPLWLELAWREIVSNKQFSAAFTLSLSLGLCGFLTLDAFKGSLTAHLDERSRGMLGADLAVSAERPLTSAEEQALSAQLPAGSRQRRELSLLSMVEHHGQARLADIKAVDADYPFYGTIGLQQQGERGLGVARALTSKPQVWVYPELLTQLHAQIGDTLKLGDREFTISDVVSHDPASASAGFSLAPKVFVGIGQLEQTALIAKGSRVFRSRLVQLPNPEVDADEVAARLKTSLTASDLRIKPHRAASEEIYKALLHLSDFMGLAALVALFLAGVGGAYLCRSFLEKRSRDIAILLSLGMALNRVRLVYVAQLILLASGATVLTAVFATLLLPLAPQALGDLMPAGVSPHLRLESLLLVFAMGVCGSLLTCLPMLARLGTIKPAALFQEGQNPSLSLDARQAGWWLPVLLLFWLLAVVTARSWSLGSLFTGIFFAAAAVFAAAALALILLLDRVASPRRPLAFWLAALSLARHRLATMASLVALGLGALLVNLIPQIRMVLEHELAHPVASSLPSLFLFDIQDEQLDPLRSYLVSQGTQLATSSPLIRARLLTINGVEVDQADDAPPAQPGSAAALRPLSKETRQELRRGYNLSYRGALSSSEELVSGVPVKTTYQAGEPADLSIEQAFAKRLGLRLGDRLRFDVQGVAADGVIVNLRRVHWTSFQPNFFVEFQPGVLEDAPKTWVGSIPGLPQAAKEQLQTHLVGSFSNVSIIDVAATIQRLLSILAQMETALAGMALLALISGFAVVLAIARYQALRRLPDVALMKALGTHFRTLRWMAVLEFGMLGAVASALGSGLSIAGARVLSYVLFDQIGGFSWPPLLLTTAALTAATTIIGLASVWRSLSVRATTMLQ